jgi:AraC-like DNA-binding protein
MPRSGSALYDDPDEFQASLPGSFDLVLERPRAFRARLTCVSLPALRLVRAREKAARAAHVTPSPRRALVSFVTEQTSQLLLDGVALPPGELFFHGAGESFHQRTLAGARWGLVCLTPATLAEVGAVVTGRPLEAPRPGHAVCPRRGDGLSLLRLHARAGRVAERTLDHIAHPEVARGLEQDLLLALVNCLADGETRGGSAIRDRNRRVLARLEAVLAANAHQLLETAEMGRLIGEPERRLNEACAQALGMGPERYQLLRRLKLARRELSPAARAGASVADVARRFGFGDLARFTVDYLDQYGELPPFGGETGAGA